MRIGAKRRRLHMYVHVYVLFYLPPNDARTKESREPRDVKLDLVSL
jgi:hypothetical protein